MTYEELVMELKSTLGVGKKVIERIFNKLIIKPELFDSLENIFREIKEWFSSIS